MAKKRTSLDTIFSTESTTTAESAPAPTSEGEKKKQIATYLHPAVYEQLRTLAFEERHKMHDYLIEGLNLVFKNRGLKSIEELTHKNK